jgi:hypothetical protein
VRIKKPDLASGFLHLEHCQNRSPESLKITASVQRKALPNMTPTMVVDLVLTMALFAHVMWSWWWVRQRYSAFLSILARPERNDLVRGALPLFFVLSVAGLVAYGAMLWRGAVLLESLGACGGGAMVLLGIVGVLAVVRLLMYGLCLSIMMLAGIYSVEVSDDR